MNPKKLIKIKSKFLQKNQKNIKRLKIWFKYYFKIDKLLWFCVMIIILSLISLIILSLIYDWNNKMIYGSLIGIVGIGIASLIYWRQLKNEIDPKLREWNEWKKEFNINSVVFDLLKFEFVFLYICEILQETKTPGFLKLKTEKDKDYAIGSLIAHEIFLIPGIDLKYFNKLKTKTETVFETLKRQSKERTICDEHINYIKYMNKFSFFPELKKKMDQLKLNIYKEKHKEYELTLTCFKNSHKIIRFQFLKEFDEELFIDILLKINWNNEFSNQSNNYTNLKTIWEEMKTIRGWLIRKIDNVLLEYNEKNKRALKEMKKLHTALSKIQSKSKEIFLKNLDKI